MITADQKATCLTLLGSAAARRQPEGGALRGARHAKRGCRAARPRSTFPSVPQAKRALTKALASYAPVSARAHFICGDLRIDVVCRLTTYRHRLITRAAPAPRAKRDSKNRGRASPLPDVVWHPRALHAARQRSSSCHST